jgi:hypothetical protein
MALGALDGLGGVDDHDAGSAADGLGLVQHVVAVTGDEGVVAGHPVGGEVLDVGDLLAPLGHERRIVLVEAAGLEAFGEQELAQGGVGSGGVFVDDLVGAVPAGVVPPVRAGDATRRGRVQL